VIPEEVKALFAGGKVIWLATVDAAGVPNVAPMLQYWWADDKTMLIGDYFMKATKANVEAVGKLCIAANDSEAKASFKLKGSARVETSGPMYDRAMAERKKVKADAPKFKSVVVFTVEEVYDLRAGENAGALMAKV